ncbi:MAG: insulinase family protein [Myxococcales bacterium]|nr:insulinase family protein [Myxococcales bacterium]
MDTPRPTSLTVRRVIVLFIAAAMVCSACGSPAPQVKKVAPPPPKEDPWGNKPDVAAIRDAGFPKATRLYVAAETATPENPGIELIVVPRHDSPAVFFKWVIPGGRRVEFDGGSRTRWPEGTVDVMARMLTEGSKNYRGGSFAATLEAYGAQLSFDVSPDALIGTGRVLSHQLDAWLTLSKEAMLAPTFESRPLRNLLTRYRARLSTLGTRPRSISQRVFNRLIYGPNHPYGSPGPTAASVKRIKASHLKKAAKSAIQLSGSTLVVVGDVDPATIAKKLRGVFGAALGGAQATLKRPAQPQPTAPGCQVVDVPKSVQTILIHGNLGPARNVPSWPHLILANQVLGGSASSRLFSELRERRGLTYGVYSSFDGRRFGGDWSVQTSVRTAKTVEALTALRSQLASMQAKPPSATEVESARRFLVGQFVMAQASGQNVAGRLASLRIFNRKDDYWQHWVKRLHTAKTETLMRAAKQWMSTTGAQTLLVGNIAKMRPALDARCPRMVLRDERGVVIRHIIGTDAEMTEADRAGLFALWASDPVSRPALLRYVKNNQRSALNRARAVHALLTTKQDADAPALATPASDWPKVAAALVPLLTRELTDVQPIRARAARRWLLDLASPLSGSSVLTPKMCTYALTAIATWAFAGIAADGVPAVAKQLATARLLESDLARLQTPSITGLEALVSTDVWRTTAAKALIADGGKAAAASLARAYRRAFIVNRALPNQADLDLLAKSPNKHVALLLFDVYTLHRLGHASSEKEPMLLRVNKTLQTMVSALAAQQAKGSRGKMTTVLSRDFDFLMSQFEALLNSPDPDDRWWAADHLVQYRGEKGLRIVMLGLADDAAYANSPLADTPARTAFTRFARSRIVPLGGPRVRPLMLAALAGRRRVNKVLAVVALRSLRDVASLTVLRTHNDKTDVGPVIGEKKRFTLSQLARSAVAVRRYIERIDKEEQAGRLKPSVATAHREQAYREYTLTGRPLAEKISAEVQKRLK